MSIALAVLNVVQSGIIGILLLKKANLFGDQTEDYSVWEETVTVSSDVRGMV